MNGPKNGRCRRAAEASSTRVVDRRCQVRVTCRFLELRIGISCQDPDADSARKAVARLLREFNANAVRRFHLPVTVAEVCDHFVQRELNEDNNYRSKRSLTLEWGLNRAGVYWTSWNCVCGRKTRLPEGKSFAGNHRYLYCPAECAFWAPRLFHPWKRESSPAFHASRSPGVLKSQSGRISLVAARRSCQRSMTDGRPQNQ